MGTAGFQNLDTTFKYRLFKSPQHEFVMSLGLSIEWGGTGAQSVGADQFNTYTPTLWFGKGLGDLPDTMSLFRPVAITGQVGYAIPGRHRIPSEGAELGWDNPVQHALPQIRGR